jgi:uncharacterized protein YegP (UPF0339 family)
MGKFVMTNRGYGEYQLNLKAGNGKGILNFEASIQNGIESVKKNALEACVVNETE